jgi:hypothetical protein
MIEVFTAIFVSIGVCIGIVSVLGLIQYCMSRFTRDDYVTI